MSLISLNPVELYDRIAQFVKNVRIPKCKKGKIGIALALRTESSEQENRLENDFLFTLRGYLDQSRSPFGFSILKFPSDLCKKLTDRATAERFMNLSRAHMLVFGSLSSRKIEGQDCFVFRLNGIVRHAHIPMEISLEFGREFRTILPNKIPFLHADELLGFESTSQWLGLAIKYIVGIASLLSGDIVLSYRLFTELENEVELVHADPPPPIVDELKKKLPLRRIETLELWVIATGRLYGEYRDPEILKSQKHYIEELLRLDPENLNGKLVMALILFHERRISEAIELFTNETSRDTSWRFSLGFLLAYDGRINDALEQYKHAFHSDILPEVLANIEIFISDVIETEPQKEYMTFFRGMINFRMKGDYSTADEDFKRFLNLDNDASMKKLIEMAKNYLGQINAHIGRANQS